MQRVQRTPHWRYKRQKIKHKYYNIQTEKTWYDVIQFIIIILIIIILIIMYIIYWLEANDVLIKVCIKE